MHIVFGISVADQPAHRFAPAGGNADDKVRQLLAGTQDDVDGILLGRHRPMVCVHETPCGRAGLGAFQLLAALSEQFARETVGRHDASCCIMHHDAGRQVAEQVVEPALERRRSVGVPWSSLRSERSAMREMVAWCAGPHRPDRRPCGGCPVSNLNGRCRSIPGQGARSAAAWAAITLTGARRHVHDVDTRSDTLSVFHG